MRYMFRISLASLILTASLLPAAEPQRDAKAEEIAHSVMNAMGGEKAWYGAHFVRFDFIVDLGDKVVANRSHLWDKMTGRYRLDDKTKDGKPRVVLFNINDRKGDAYVDGMTAQSVSMEEPLLRRMSDKLLALEGICGVFYDVTHKPPGTIEWE